MADAHANPSRDPADDGSLLGMARAILDKFLQGVDDMLPARVVTYDRATNRATVVPMVKVLTTDNRQVSRAQIASVPVLQLGAGGVVLSLTLKPGDLGWIKANDRDISIVMQAYVDNAPNTLRKHSFQDAMFIPDVMHGITTVGEDAENAVLQTLDGNCRVAIWPDRVKLSAGALSVEIGPASIEVIGPVNFHDPVAMAQTLAVNGLSTLAGGATIGGIPFDTHKHTGVQTGGGTSGGPTA
jgi:hypothetical protein